MPILQHFCYNYTNDDFIYMILKFLRICQLILLNIYVYGDTISSMMVAKIAYGKDWIEKGGLKNE